MFAWLGLAYYRCRPVSSGVKRMRQASSWCQVCSMVYPDGPDRTRKDVASSIPFPCLTLLSRRVGTWGHFSMTRIRPCNVRTKFPIPRAWLYMWRSDAIVVQVRHTKLLGLGALVHAGYIGINCTCVLLRLDSCVAEYFLSTLAGPCIDSEYPALPS